MEGCLGNALCVASTGNLNSPHVKGGKIVLVVEKRKNLTRPETDLEVLAKLTSFVQRCLHC